MQSKFETIRYLNNERNKMIDTVKNELKIFIESSELQSVVGIFCVITSVILILRVEAQDNQALLYKAAGMVFMGILFLVSSYLKKSNSAGLKWSKYLICTGIVIELISEIFTMFAS